MDTPPTLRPAEVAVAIVEQGVMKHKDRYEVVFIKAFLGGVMLSFGGLLSEIVTGGSAGLTASNPGLVKVLGGFVFPVGLVMIVLQGLDLVTSNMMIMTLAMLKRAIPWWGLPLNWFIVTFGNLAGSLFCAAILVHYSGIVTAEPYHTSIQTFALHKAADPEWHQIFLRGIACNWLVCVAIWQAAGAKDTISKIYSIWIPIWVFVACGFDHVVANMFSIPLGIMLGADMSVASYIRKSLIAAYLGNIIGALLVGLPAAYFYLSDYGASGMRSAENGDAETLNGEAQASTSRSASNLSGTAPHVKAN